MLESSEGDVETFEFSLSDILMFVTGSSSIPALGLSPKPTLAFQSNGPLSIANTCANVIHLLLMHANGLEKFQLFMCMAICNSHGFGRL